jgi:hypothetical protein
LAIAPKRERSRHLAALSSTQEWGKKREHPFGRAGFRPCARGACTVERAIALAGGAKKNEAIAGAIRVGVIDMLVTDKFTAHRMADL